ncbi:hypothetical protein E2562_002175 [Oryza meyeriana var. granulata]|uniref:Uncharacterized protein n=1 Tax=Oryza meyeriana var. granulata TaxID=110450 RepID=A0A6G1EDS5_9ORYZ|nr:hypothetical protein E2562_002175 [Oryza meyeriana var. granulata]
MAMAEGTRTEGKGKKDEEPRGAGDERRAEETSRGGSARENGGGAHQRGKKLEVAAVGIGSTMMKVSPGHSEAERNLAEIGGVGGDRERPGGLGKLEPSEKEVHSQETRPGMRWQVGNLHRSS